LGFENVKNDFVADRIHHGGVDKACYLYSLDHYSFWKMKYPNLDWDHGMFGENITVAGLNETELFIGDIFQNGETIVQVTQPRQPCYKMGVMSGDLAIIKEFIEAPYPGIYVRVLQESLVKKGDEINLIKKGSPNFSVLRVFQLIFQTESDSYELEKLKVDPFLVTSIKNKL
jgi:MOSC domain-containing protein YiiM